MSLVNFFLHHSCRSLKTTLVTGSGVYVVGLMLFICFFFLIAKSVVRAGAFITKAFK